MEQSLAARATMEAQSLLSLVDVGQTFLAFEWDKPDFDRKCFMCMAKRCSICRPDRTKSSFSAYQCLLPSEAPAAPAMAGYGSSAVAASSRRVSALSFFPGKVTAHRVVCPPLTAGGQRLLRVSVSAYMEQHEFIFPIALSFWSSVSPALCLCCSLFLRVYVGLSLSPSLFLSPSVCVSVSLSFCLFLSLCHTASLPLNL